VNRVYEFLCENDDDLLVEFQEDWGDYEMEMMEEKAAVRKYANILRGLYGSPNDELSYWMKEVAFEAYRIMFERVTGQFFGK
jgi:hypothetical protein